MEKSDAIDALAALAQDTRLDIFRLLVAQGPDGLSAGKIGHALGLAPATLSFHLQQMRQAKLLTSRRSGRQMIYAADFEAMSALMAYLTENCCQGRPADCAVPPLTAAAAESAA